MKKFAVIITKLIFKILYRIEIIDENKIPVSGSAILCANHNTMIDMFFLGFKIKRWIYWMAKEELFKNPILSYIFKKLGAFPIKRGTGDVGSIKTAYKLLQDGNIVGIFPQGTRVKAGITRNARIKPGAAMLAINAGVQIIPAAVIGTYKLFSKMQVKYGEPFRLDADSNKKYTKDEMIAFSEEIMKKIAALSEV